MDKLDEALKAPVDHNKYDEIETAVQTLNNLSSTMWVLEHYACVLVDIVDILLQKKIRNEELLRQNSVATPDLTEHTTRTRIAFDTQLDAIYRSQLAEIARLNSATVNEDGEGGYITLERMNAYAIFTKNCLICISTFAAKLEDLLREEDEGSAIAIRRLMKTRHPEAYEAFERWMTLLGANGSVDGDRGL
jgi:hypothetical protein